MGFRKTVNLSWRRHNPVFELKLDIGWDYEGQRGKQTLFHTAIRNFKTGLNDWSGAFRAMVPILEDSVEQQFKTQGHGTWAQLARSTIARKKGSTRILFDSGRLMKSFLTGGADHVEDISPRRFRWGSTVPYALFHQTGTGDKFQFTSGPGTATGLPMRRIMESETEFGWVARRNRQMRSAMVKHLANMARRTGFAVLSGQTDVTPELAMAAGRKMVGL